MTDPDPEAEANVSGVTDEQWLAGHRALMASGDIPPEELGYLYDPDRPADTVIPADLTVDRDPAEPDEVSLDG